MERKAEYYVWVIVAAVFSIIIYEAEVQGHRADRAEREYRQCLDSVTETLLHVKGALESGPDAL